MGPHAARDAAAVCRVELSESPDCRSPCWYCWHIAENAHCQSPACHWQSCDAEQLAGVLEGQYIQQFPLEEGGRQAALLSVVGQTNACPIFFSVFLGRVTHSSFHRTMKGQSGGRTSGSSRRNVSVSQLGIGTNTVILESRSPEDEVSGRVPCKKRDVRWNPQQNMDVFCLCTSEPVWETFACSNV